MPDTDAIAARLRRYPASDDVRASAWDAFHDATDEHDLTERLRGLALPDDVKADLWDMKSGRAAAPAPSGVRVSGDSFADKIANAAGVLGHGALGVVKGAARSALHAAEAGINAGVIPGGIPGQGSPAIDYLAQGVQPQDTAETVGGWLETGAELAAPAMEAGKLAIAGGRALATKAAPMAARAAAEAGPALTRIGNSTVLDFASHVPGIGTPIHWARTGAKVLGHVLDIAAEKAATKAAPAAANAGGRVVAAGEPTLQESLASALEELRAPAATPPVQLPPSPSLPPGYTPRATVPRAVPTRAAAPAPTAAAPPKRAYFLKPESEISAAATPAPAIAPKAELAVSDLPAAWQNHVGQDIFPMTGAMGKEVEAALVSQLTERGVSVGKAMMDVSKNKDIPVQIKQQLLKALSRVSLKGAQ